MMRIVLFLLLVVGLNCFSVNQIFYYGNGTDNRPGIFSTTNGLIGARDEHGLFYHRGLNSLIVFGGYGYDTSLPNGAVGHLNDIWRFDLSTSKWSFFDGNATISIKGVYSPTNALIGSRADHTVSYDETANVFYVVAGFGVDSTNNAGYLNDVWKYDFNLMKWTFLAGNTTIIKASVYSSPYGQLGSRVYHSMSYANGSLYVFGGLGYDTNITSTGILNDLWKFDLSINKWSFMAGNTTRNVIGVYSSTDGLIGSRQGSTMIYNSVDGYIYIFGGYGYDSFGIQIGYLNDLWKVDLKTKKEMFVTGDISTLCVGNYSYPYGRPGGRSDQAMVYHPGYNSIYVFGGQGYDTTISVGYMADLWQYDMGLGQWIYLFGAQARDKKGNYTSPFAAGARRYSKMALTMNFTTLHLFAGIAIDINGNTGYMNDLWIFNNIGGCGATQYGFTCSQSCSCPNGFCFNGISGNGSCGACNPGYYGLTCNKACTCMHGVCDGIYGTGVCSSCTQGYYGINCDKTCTCVNGICSGISGNGTCSSCNPGYHGLNCDQPCTCVNGTCDDSTGLCSSCKPGYYGINCDKACTCVNGTCDNRINGNGQCTSCTPGFFGNLCTNQCLCKNNCTDGINGTGACGNCYVGHFGKFCNNSCTCVNGQCDDDVNGTGVCKVCIQGNIGINCDKNCTCKNGQCIDGVTGSGTCSNCNPGSSGPNCDIPCTCINGPCNQGLNGTGTCISCNIGFAGVNCDIPCGCVNGQCDEGINGTGKCTSCLSNAVGPYCNLSCTCVNGICLVGVNSTGTCQSCNPRYAGVNCDIQCKCLSGTCSLGINGTGNCTSCNKGYWGPKCDSACTCLNGNCSEGINGTGTCSVCAKGYSGTICDKACTCQNGNCSEGITGNGQCTGCLPGYAGDNCQSKCTCQSGTCSEGLGGTATCSTCEPGYFGTNCDTSCYCVNGTCSEGITGTGYCTHCNYGFVGSYCNQTDNSTVTIYSASCTLIISFGLLLISLIFA